MANNRDTLELLTDEERGKRFIGTCTTCGSTRIKKMNRGNANNGSIPAWNFRCFDCGAYTVGLLVCLPPGMTTLNALDENERMMRRIIQRKIRVRKALEAGRPLTRDFKPRGNARKTSDNLIFEITVVHGQGSGPRINSHKLSKIRIDVENPPDEPVEKDGSCWHCGYYRTQRHGLCKTCLNHLDRARPQEQAS